MSDSPYLFGRIGDVNGDGIVNPSDAQLALVLAVGPIIAGNRPELDSDQLRTTDVDLDGNITPNDSNKILAYGSDTVSGKDPHWDDYLVDSIEIIIYAGYYYEGEFYITSDHKAIIPPVDGAYYKDLTSNVTQIWYIYSDADEAYLPTEDPT